MFRQFLILLLCFISTAIFADSSFIIHHIQIRGLQRISKSAVMAAMPVHTGQLYTTTEGNHVIAALFHTGFFSDVQLMRQDNVLVVSVVERPTIDSITITGNKAIKAKQLKPVLKNLNIVVGDTYDPSELHAIVQGLQQQYALLGHADAIVTPSVTTLSRNRVAIKIVVQEGQPLIVHAIHVDGNHAFSEHVVLDQFKLTTPSIFTWFNHNDRYSKTRLDDDLQNLQNFYYNHGYLDFRVVNKDIVPSGNNHVNIHLTIFEGAVYRIVGYQVMGMKLPSNMIPRTQKILSQFKTGDIFSKSEVLKINQQLNDYLANHGYAFAVINAVPTLDHVAHTVSLAYTIECGQRVYVRKVHIMGNARTTGTVIRANMVQMEGSLYSLKDIKESKRRLNGLGYLDQIQETSTPVPNQNDQVDLTYHVHEVSAGRASVQAGYSDLEGFLYGASISEPNFLGTGKYVSVGFQRSAYTSTYSFSYNNPFFTTTGISRGFSVYYNHTTPANVNLQPYTMDDYGANMTFGIPISEYDQFLIGGGYDNISILNVNQLQISPPAFQFLTQHPAPYNQFKLTSGISHGTLNRAIFATKGNTQNLSLAVGLPMGHSTSLGYYQVGYTGQWYQPLFAGFILDPHVQLGYGNGLGNTTQLPFFDNYYAGGIQTLPGYENNTLGPKNPNNTTQALGGNLQTLGGLNFILPEFITHKVRTAVFVDAGNIFQTGQLTGVTTEAISLQNLRVTTGVMISWWSPLGAPLDFSVGFPLNKKPGDQLSWFGFSFGATI